MITNDPALVARLSGVFSRTLGEDGIAVLKQRPGADTLAAYSPPGEPPIPSVLLCLGVADPEKVAQSKATGVPLPATHSARYAPLAAPALRTAMTALRSAVLELLPARP